MKDEYDFSQGTRGALLPNTGKTRITIFLDDTLLEAFRTQALEEGTGYQTIINRVLQEYLAQGGKKSMRKADSQR
jgi:uncharacterized protein (DUF4415 family)